MAEIVLRGVGHRYPGAVTDTFADIDLVVAKGEAHALLGGSGAGKSTLLNVLSGLTAPSAGEVLFDGEPVTVARPRERNVAQVFQFPVLYESLPVAENLAFPLRNRGWSRADIDARVADIAERLSLEAALETKPASLSLFQKQLVSIGRAIVRPDVALVLLDEPLTAVEPATKWQLRRVLKQAQRELGATMIYVTHDQTEALTFADRISVLHDGELLQTGSPEALYATPAHEHVAHFIGSPGMNLVPGEVSGGVMRIAGQPTAARTDVAAGPCTVGFRPEWATVTGDSTAGPEVRVHHVRVLGTRDRRPLGIVTAELAGEVVHTRQILDVAPGQTAWLDVDVERLVAFRDGHRLGAEADA